MHDRDTRSDREAQRDDLPSRAFLDGDGVYWKVFEKAFDAFDRRSGMSLIFLSDSAMRRVRNYPQDWMDLSDEDLLALSWAL